jgi:hypothetical protein
VYKQSSDPPFRGQYPLPSSKVTTNAALVFLNVLLFRMLGITLLRYLSPSLMQVLLSAVVQPFEQPLAAFISLQSFGVSHMKFGAEFELRSLTMLQSVTLQPLGFASTILSHRAALDVMSWNTMNPL